MFKGKVTIIRNVNGKEERVEREFDSQKEYQKFIQEHGDVLSAALPDPRLSLSEWGALGGFIDRVFEEKLADFFLPSGEENNDYETAHVPVDISRYEREAEKLEEEKRAKKDRVEGIKRAIEKLKGYIKTFNKEGKKELAESARTDLKKLEDELAALK